MAKKIDLEKIDYCNNSDMFRAYKGLVDFDNFKHRNERAIIEFAGNFIPKGAKRKRFLKIFRMSTDEFEAGGASQV